MADDSRKRFTLLGELGRGGMATVHLAVDSRAGERVALKLLHAHLADRPSARRRLERELAASRAVDHAAVLEVREVVQHDGRLGLVLPLCAGGTLSEQVAAGGPLPKADLLALRDTLTGALRAAHKAGVLHRDVAPGNVLLDGSGPRGWRLTDFGLARLAEGHTASTTALGTPGYAAPEAYGPGRADPAIDAWAVGAVLFFAATGMAPFGSDGAGAVLGRQLAGAPVVDLREARPDLPNSVADGILGLLNPDPTQRYTLARAAAAVAIPTPAQPTHGWRPAAIGGLVSVGLLVLIGFFQDFGSFLISTIVDGHAIPRADVFEMTQGISALLLLPLALLPAVVAAWRDTQPDPSAGRRWMGVGALTIVNLVYGLAAAVVLPELGMRSAADLFGTMLFHQMVWIPLVAMVLAAVRPWVGLQSAPPEPPPVEDGLVDQTRRALTALQQALADAPEVTRIDLSDAVRSLVSATDVLATQRALQRPQHNPTAEASVADLSDRLARARTLGTAQVAELEQALANAETLRDEADAAEREWTRVAARLVEIQATALKLMRTVRMLTDTPAVTQALEDVRRGTKAAAQTHKELG